MDPVKRIALIRIVDDDGGVRESYKFLIEKRGLAREDLPERRGVPRGATTRCAGLRRLRRPHDGNHGHGSGTQKSSFVARKSSLPVDLRERRRRHRDGRQGDEARRGGLPHQARRRREAPLLDRPRRRKKLRGSGRGRNGPRTCGPLAGAQSPRVPGRAARRRGPHHEGRLRRTRHRRAHRTGPRRPRSRQRR